MKHWFELWDRMIYEGVREPTCTMDWCAKIHPVVSERFRVAKARDTYEYAPGMFCNAQLNSHFVWDETIEGHAYWADIYNKIYRLQETNYLKFNIMKSAALKEGDVFAFVEFANILRIVSKIDSMGRIFFKDTMGRDINHTDGLRDVINFSRPASEVK